MKTEIKTRKNKDTVEVYARHSADCKHKSKGRFYGGCSCMKWLYIYKDGVKEERSAKTRTWSDAERQRQEILDSWDPTKVELAQLKEKNERGLRGIREAVELHVADMRVAGRAKGTINCVRNVLGGKNEATGHGRYPNGADRGHLFKWLDKYNADQPEALKLTTINQVTPSILTAWRSTWNWGDLTAYTNWIRVVIFFNWCVKQGWLTENPAHKVSHMQVQRGSRTTIFTEEQYAKIIDASYLWCPVIGLKPEDQKVVPIRTRVFIEWMRWSGMSIQDVICLRPNMIDGDGLLRYRRIKTDQLAVVPMPKRVLELLKSMPMATDSEPGYYFRHQNSIDSDVRRWIDRLQNIFSLAGINTVKTEIRERRPHPHMLRDTFAVWYITHGIPLNEVAKMLGHSNSKVTEKCYLPWVEMMESTMVSRVRDVLNEGAAPVVSIKSARRPKEAMVQ